jgi:predicted HNH restriction endonuclease
VKKSKTGKPYHYDPKEYKERFEDQDNYHDEETNLVAKESHMVDVDWFYKDLENPIEIMDEQLKKKVSNNATIIELEPHEAGTIISIAKMKRPGIDFSKFIAFLQDKEEFVRPIEEDSDVDIEERLRNLKAEDEEVLEGKKEFREVIWRKRNRSIIEQAKSKSDYTCEVCSFNFEKSYGSIGRAYIVAHHLKPIKYREKPEKTRLSDISIVCDNCHRMLHKRDPPYSLEELEKMLR